MAVKSNWADRRHCPPGSDMAVNEHKALASGFVLPKPERKTHIPGLSGPGTGAVKVPGLSMGRK